MQIGNASLGSVAWDVNLLRFFAGKMSADIHVQRESGSVQATVSKGFGKQVRLSDIRGVMPIASMGGLGLPGGWQGDVRLQIATLDLENSWPVQARGMIDVNNLVGPANQPTALGNFHAEFAGGASTQNALSGTLTSTGDGPLDVNGTLRLLPNRTYVIDAQVATRPNAPASIAKALQYLGPPDSQGRRPLSISGSI